ncbi:exonuclease [Burkholderia stagnalis]|uniref:3'-5' exoribonuclease domain-containing protein n=1 Tax=Burkholderia stagnalis TaxID=1503054 RepID=UPI00075D69CC|nr:3'-5' exoribonuclease [Burkholderia stagnalis]KVD89706.1 exonuclease [Burkholderia stagnalis]KWK48500.1 exonuclease [Burkholderia stagnalis]KWK54834.1 exonuclease [Burkholderia stagnalis]KWN76093.1 exonuclease [Burkholderia stagnalis]
MSRIEIFVSTDVETDGPIPGAHSMLSLGSAAFLADGTCIGTFSGNLAPLPEARPDPKTMEWWRSQPDAYSACTRDARDPGSVMSDYHAWLSNLPGKPLFVGYPASFDFLFVYWYLIRFCQDSPFGHSAIDIRSYAMGLLRSDYRSTAKRHLPQSWTTHDEMAHVALDDAIEQGKLFCNMLRHKP